ncbi:MAG: hypothetical protein HRU20_25585 [Pseudomonadales bacterium]|nr:hypothetical protein [Pseudomonadales bacterium]
MNLLNKLSLLLFPCLFISSFTWADSKSIDITLGAYAWYSDISGDIIAEELNLGTNIDESPYKFNSVVYLEFNHALRYLPDLLFTQNNIQQTGTGTQNYNRSRINLTGSVDLSHYDVTAFYAPITGTFSWQLGATLRKFNGDLQLAVINSNEPLLLPVVDLTTDMGMLYNRFQFPLKTIPGLQFDISLNAGKNSRKKAADLILSLNYEMPSGLGFSGGYRDLYAEIIGRIRNEYITTTVKINGPFAALYYHF